jgi:serine/threonine protein kinase
MLFSSEKVFDYELSDSDDSSISEGNLADCPDIVLNNHISATEEDEDDEEVLTMARVRFNSLCLLPSEIECLGIERETDSQEITIKDFILLKTISSGAYGNVILSRKKNTKDLFAIKVLDKEKMVEKNVTEFVMNERDILNQVNNEFIVRGVYTFQSKKYLYMVMEFMKGGDFNNMLQEIGYFDQDRAKFYLS